MTTEHGLQTSRQMRDKIVTVRRRVDYLNEVIRHAETMRTPVDCAKAERAALLWAIECMEIEWAAAVALRRRLGPAAGYHEPVDVSA